MSYVDTVFHAVVAKWSWAELAVGILATLLGVYAAFTLDRLQDRCSRIRDCRGTLSALLEEIYEVNEELVLVNKSFATATADMVTASWSLSVEFHTDTIDLSAVRAFRSSPLAVLAPTPLRTTLNEYISKVSALVRGVQTKRLSDALAIAYAPSRDEGVDALTQMQTVDYRATWLAHWRALTAGETLCAQIDKYVNGRSAYKERLREILTKHRHVLTEPPDWTRKDHG